jgi:P-type Ca2+ transporter type 2C
LRKQPADGVYQAMADDAGNLEKLDRFIVPGLKAAEGTGTVLVTTVGNSAHGRTTMAPREDQSATPLQKKHKVLADYIAELGGESALLLSIVLFIIFLIQLKSLDTTQSNNGQAFLHIFIVAVTVVVVVTYRFLVYSYLCLIPIARGTKPSGTS